MLSLTEMLRTLTGAGADSLQFRPGQPPLLFKGGEPRALDGGPLSQAALSQLMDAVVDADQLAALVARGQVDGVYVHESGRFQYRVRRLPEGMAVAFRPTGKRSPGKGSRPAPRIPAPRIRTEAPEPEPEVAGPPPRASGVVPPVASARARPPSAPAREDESLQAIDEPPWLARFRQCRTLTDMLRLMMLERASDLVLSTGRDPRVRKIGDYRAVTGHTVREKALLETLGDMMTPARKARLEEEGSVDLGFELPADGADRHRFRVNVFRTISGLAAAFRPVWGEVPGLGELRLPEAIAELGEFPYGLVMVCGPTGSGKSTTLSALVEHINAHHRRHILTLEDPIEYLFEDKQSIIHQREVGVHVTSFAAGLRDGLREAPDVILVGEMRDLETIAAAITAAETGHLVLSTLHSGSASQAIDRMIDIFPEHQQQQIRMQVADVLRAVVTQRLLPTHDGSSRVPVVEIVRANYAIANMIRERRTHHFTTAIQSGRKDGMLPFDTSLAELVRQGDLSREAALRVARDAKHLRTMLDG